LEGSDTYSDGRESTTDGGATSVAAARDVGQGSGGGRVQPRVQEPETSASGCDELAVDELDDAGEGGSCATGAINGLDLLSNNNLEINSGGGDIGVSTAGRVVVCRVAVRVLC
jgi:hypothetical protein